MSTLRPCVLLILAGCTAAPLQSSDEPEPPALPWHAETPARSMPWRATPAQLAAHATENEAIHLDMASREESFGSPDGGDPGQPHSPSALTPAPYNAGADDDSIVTDTTSFPHSASVSLFMTFAADPGTTWHCSGVMINPHHVLTAGHCIYDHDSGYGWAASVLVVPGMNGDDVMPFGYAWATSLHTYTGWTSSGDMNHDMAFLLLDRDIGGATGYFGWEYYGSGSDYDGETLQMDAYPAVEWGDGYTMYANEDFVDYGDDYGLYHYLDTTGGTSGGGMWRYDSTADDHYIHGVNGWEIAYGDGTYLNFGTRFTSSRISDLTGYESSDPAPDADPDLVDGASALADTTLAPGDSTDLDVVIRNIGSGDAGSFSIAWYLSTNTTISSSDTKIAGASCSSGVSAGSRCSGTITASIPSTLADGTYYFGWVIDGDGDVSELDESNNSDYHGTVTITSSLPDLVDAGTTLLESSADPGDTVTLDIDFENVGAGPAADPEVTYYLSTNSTISSSDTRLTGVTCSGTVSAGGHCAGTVSATVPSTIASGDYYFGWVIDPDGAIAESDESNNTGTGGTIRIGADLDGDGYTNAAFGGSDCDDGDAGVHPGGAESCDGEDDDCDGTVDDGVKTTWYADSDGDGYGNAARTTSACSVPSGYTSNATDCDDGDAGAHPGAVEVCDEADDDCDGSVDEGGESTWYRDADDDGYGDPSQDTRSCSAPPGFVPSATDCDDGDASAWPGAAEACDGVDDDCDGAIDEGVELSWYADSDGDGFGDAARAVVACAAPGGFVADASDCDDTRSDVRPGAAEVCDDVDQDCDGDVDEDLATQTWHPDADGDGFGDPGTQVSDCGAPAGWVTDGTDCADEDVAVNPDATETWYDGVDQDCDGRDDDQDGDGAGIAHDCDDQDPALIQGCEEAPKSDPEDGEGGCGCHASGAPGGLLLSVLALVAGRRRR